MRLRQPSRAGQRGGQRSRVLRGRGWRGRLPWVVAVAFSVSGVIHLVRPAVFTGIVPGFLPDPAAWVRVSGVAEVVCAAGLWRRATWAGWASAALLVAIWPANLQMALTVQAGSNVGEQVAVWARLPLQVPLIWCALGGPSWRHPAGRMRHRPAPTPSTVSRVPEEFLPPA